MVLNRNIIVKYNNLFTEACLYYGINARDIEVGRSNLYMLQYQARPEFKSYNDVNYYSLNYKYLLPFIQFYNDTTYEYISINLKNINASMEKLRKEREPS